MKRASLWPARVLCGLALAVFVMGGATAAPGEDGFTTGKPEIQSMSILAFGPDGVLLIGDSKGGAIFALDLKDTEARGKNDSVEVSSIEAKIAALLGTTATEIMIHDLAANPLSQNIYLSVSRGRGKWDSTWKLPNDVADADVLLRVRPDSEIEMVSLDSVRHARAALPNPVDAGKTHRWKDGVSLRSDTITDIVHDDGTVYVAGLSNEEFASTMWQIPFPFKKGFEATTLEVFHGAHGEYETHAPIRTFVTYELKDDPHFLAAYLCTPLVTFPVSDMEDGKHVKGRTVAEFGSGNYPLDMVLYKKDGEDRLLIANSNLPFMVVDPRDIESFKGEINTEVDGYLGGVSYEPRSGTGIVQMDTLNEEFFVALQRQAGGNLDLRSWPVRRF